MPCRCDIPEPTARERETMLVSQLLVYVLPKLGEKVPAEIKSMADSIQQVRTGKLDDMTALLCQICSNMPEPQASDVIWDGRVDGARKLASWWQEHQAADKARHEREAEVARKARVKAEALAKLTPEEREVVLGE